MIYDNLEFVNVRELTECPGRPGLRLDRYPKAVREKILTKGPVSFSNGCEIRFQADAPVVLYLMADRGREGEVAIYRGDYLDYTARLPVGVVTPLVIQPPLMMERVGMDKLPMRRFSNHVCRVLCNAFDSVVHYCGVEAYGSLTPPDPANVPDKTLCCYGSSITHGAWAIGHHNSYVQTCARELGVDVWNLGLSGGCKCEPEVADFLSELPWDYLTMELGVNMRQEFTPETFAQRAGYLVDTVCQKRPKEPKFLITIFPNGIRREDPAITELEARNERAFNQTLRELASQYADKNLTLVEGSSVLTDFTWLATDLLHPSDTGQILMGHTLAGILKQHL